VKFTAIVLAGSRPGGDAFAEQFGADQKALIPIAGEPMVRRPVRALLGSENVSRILVLSQSPQAIAAALPDDPRVEVRASEGTIAQTIARLLDDQRLSFPLLVTTADHALLDSNIVDEFVTAAADADIAIGVVERANMLRRLPTTERTWLKFRGGAFTGANLFVLKSRDIGRALALWRSVEQDRKKSWRVISVLGPVTLALAALRMLNLEEVLGQLGTRLALSIKAVRLTNPLAGVDVDKADDHALVEAILAGRA
jgi:GTP:adenosylcobinamide-phosphate guanylyltransferase